MIVFRYLAREVLSNMLAVSLVLLLIIISARFASYLAEAAAGDLDAGVLFTLMVYRLPGFLELILPLGLFLGILMAYGRMYVDSEMTVLSACGMSQGRLIVYTVLAALVVSLAVGGLSLYLTPEGVRASEQLLIEQRNRTDFETLKPARFHELDGGKGISYAQSMSDDQSQLRNVFMARMEPDAVESELTVLTAETGETVIDAKTGVKYLQLRNGRRYVGRPGDVDYKVVEFDTFSQYLPEPDYDAVKSKKETDALSTTELMQRQGAQVKAALQWRFSMPVLVLVVALLAVPLSRTQPRQGRYAKMLPAILLYIVYLVCVNAARGAIESGTAPLPGMLWLVHTGFFVFALLLIGGRQTMSRLLGHRQPVGDDI